MLGNELPPFLSPRKRWGLDFRKLRPFCIYCRRPILYMGVSPFGPNITVSFVSSSSKVSPSSGLLGFRSARRSVHLRCSRTKVCSNRSMGDYTSRFSGPSRSSGPSRFSSEFVLSLAFLAFATIPVVPAISLLLFTPRVRISRCEGCSCATFAKDFSFYAPVPP